MTYFFAWVTTSERNGGGGGGKDWVDRHIHALTNIAGPLLGVPKSITAIMSGEMKDTNLLMGTFDSILEQFFGRRRRQSLWSSWGSLWAMLPKGGNKIWGVGADMCDDGQIPHSLKCRGKTTENALSNVPILSLIDHSEKSGRDIEEETENSVSKKRPLEGVIAEYSKKSEWTVDETLSFLLKWGVGLGQKHAGTKYNALGRRRTKQSPQDWNDPTTTPLPKAPGMKIYCLYGVGLETERAFFYKRNFEDCKSNETSCTSQPIDLPFLMDGSVENQEQNISYGVKVVDGDGSVPLISLGYMCVDGWRKKGNLNPSGIEVITREYLHQQEFIVDDPMRGGPKSAEHVDIMGNIDVTKDVLRIATNFNHDEVKTKIVSDIERIAARIRERSSSTRGLKGWKSKLSSHSIINSMFRRGERSRNDSRRP